MTRHCEDCKHKDKTGFDLPCCECININGEGSLFELKIITNADRIRSMTDKELAEFLHDFDECDYCNRAEEDGCTREDCEAHSVKAIVDWLQKDSEV